MTESSNHVPIDHSDVPIRLFRSDFLEFFTHISPIVVLAIWGPVALYFLVTALRGSLPGGAWLTLPLGFLLGLFLWTLTEYGVHRFVFHHEARSPRQQRIFFLFHGVHHAQPQCKTRLVMPPIVSVPLALIFYGLFYLVWAVILGEPQWIAPCFAGFVTGYLAYDMIHYATHHFPMRWGFLKFLKRYHMQHHYNTPDARYGVSSPLWDRVFGTYPA
jgi:sterol desaturase/sphingolipid hydroxylase (fatty acid hydroxylase superfamily)